VCALARSHVQVSMKHVTQATNITDYESIVQRIAYLQELEEARFLVDFHQTVEKAKHKSWHDRNIKSKRFVKGDKVLLYDSRYQKNSGNLCMHCFGPFIVVEIRHSSVVKLAQLDGIL
jgi:hypothetical protein